MIVKTDYIWMNTDKRKCLIHITDKVEEFIEQSGISEGMVLVSAMHITAGIIVNDYESGLWDDILAWLEDIAPVGDYKHHQTGEDNGDAVGVDAFTDLEYFNRELCVQVDRGLVCHGDLGVAQEKRIWDHGNVFSMLNLTGSERKGLF